MATLPRTLDSIRQQDAGAEPAYAPETDADLEKLFWTMRRRNREAILATKLRMFKSRTLIGDLARVVTVCPVIEAYGMFQVDPAPASPKSAWRWIIAVRQRQLYPDLSPGAYEDFARRECTDGRDIVDLIACSPDLMTVTSRFTGLAAVAGWPQEPSDAAKPVRVRETPLSWLVTRCDGVFLCGTDIQQQEWLRGCRAGLIAPTLAMGEAIRKKMERPLPPLPKILVDA